MKKNASQHQTIPFTVTPATWKLILSYYKQEYGGVIPDSFPMELFARQRLESSTDQLRRLKSLKIPKNKLCLDAGCGMGSFLICALKAGYNYYGYEVDKKAFTIARLLLKENGLSPNRIRFYKKGVPFKKKFDFITSFEVVEHVNNLDRYIHELSLCLAKNGKLFIETPNYVLPYEPHYYIFLPALLPKQISWLFCKAGGRTNRKFFNELNFVTPMSLKSSFKKARLQWKSFGQEEWFQQITIKPSNNRSSYVKTFSKILKQMRMRHIILWTAKLGLYTPQVYLAYFPKNK